MKIIIWRALLALYLLAITLGSLWPLTQAPAPGGDKLHHFVGYALLAWLLRANALRAWPAWLFASGFGVLIEIAQSFTVLRRFEFADMLANACGALLGLALWYFLPQRVKSMGIQR